MSDNLENKDQTKDSFDFQGNYQKKYENIKNLVQAALNQLEKVQNAIEILESEDRRAHYQNIPGTEGVFDGQYLIAQDGRKTEVPSNYAAKSKLVYGDILKVFTDSGRQIFKQIDRVERKTVEGVLTKKEGKWYLLTDIGTYKISDASAEYHKAELNNRASALIPAQNPKVPFASLEKVFNENSQLNQPSKINNKEFKEKNDTKVYSDKKPIKNKPIIKKIPVTNASEEKSSKFVKKDQDLKQLKLKKVEKSEIKEDKSKTEYIDNIMGDDDLR